MSREIDIQQLSIQHDKHVERSFWRLCARLPSHETEPKPMFVDPIDLLIDKCLSGDSTETLEEFRQLLSAAPEALDSVQSPTN